MTSTLSSNARARSAFDYSRISRTAGSRTAKRESVTSPVFAGYELAYAGHRFSEAINVSVVVLSIVATCVLLVIR